MSTPTLTLSEDRLLPRESSALAAAREIYRSTKGLPIISPHGHVPVSWIADDMAFSDPTSLLITPDHYVNRLLHANGVDLEDLGVGRKTMSEEDNRRAFRILCEHWRDFAGTAMRYWLVDQLVGIFGITERPSPENADRIYDTIAERIAQPDFLPRALMDSFDIAFIATTDDPCDDLDGHARLAADETFTRRVAPTFRPDKYLEPAAGGWTGLLARVSEVSGCDATTLDGFTEAMEDRRAYFRQHGAVSSDHSHRDLGTIILDHDRAASIFDASVAGRATVEEMALLRRHLFTDQARMASEDGLTMTVHPAVHRNHDTAAFHRFGADIGSDVPVTLEVVDSLHPLLDKFGNTDLKLVVFTIDETLYSREIAPLSGWYRSLYIGAPWWFIDAPESVMRFKHAVTEMAGFSRVSGMIDDTRAFCSIPARHDMSRRLDAAHLAELVVLGRLDLDEAVEIAHRLVVEQPTQVFGL